MLQGTVVAQPLAAAAAAAAWTLPRTIDGQPDLQGVWANNTATPLERPKELEGRESLTDQEVEAFRKKASELFDGNGDAAFGDEVFRAVLASVQGSDSGPHQKPATDFDGDTGDYSSVWIAPRDWAYPFAPQPHLDDYRAVTA